jgi:hypothetical protein
MAIIASAVLASQSIPVNLSLAIETRPNSPFQRPTQVQTPVALG